MISYSWNNQEARKVHKFLEDKGCGVWCDERKVVGNLVDAMVKAVFACEVFVCRVSLDYFKSAYYQLEFEFAKKTPAHN